jgi:hypothetical protein
VDPNLSKRISAETPKFNRLVADGFAVSQMALVEQYIDDIWRAAAKRFPPGLEYKGYVRCTPLEEYAEVTRKRNKQTFELTQSDVYMVRYLLSLNGKPLKPRYVYLPYVGQAGSMKIYDSTYFISPVLSDVSISVVKDTVFIPVSCARLTFHRIMHSFMANEEVETDYVVWSGLHNQFGKKIPGNDKSDSGVVIDAKTSLVHYFFCKHGFTEAFARFTGVVPVLSDGPFDPKEYDPEEWVICRSTGIRPKGVKILPRYYVPTNLHLAVRRSDYDSVVRSYISSFFYIVDHFPDRVTKEYAESERLWRILLGKIIWQGNTNEGKLVELIDTHIRSLDTYLDLKSQQGLRDDNIFVDDIYEFCQHIIETMGERVRNTDTANMYDKRLTVLRYALFDLIGSIFQFSWKFNSPDKKDVTEKDVDSFLNKLLRLGAVLDIRKGEHGESSNITAPGDNYLFRMTANLVLQTDASNKGKRNPKASVSDPAKLWHSSIYEVGSYRNLPKSEPTGRSRINPYVNVLPDGSIVRDPERVELLDEIQKMIQR